LVFCQVLVTPLSWQVQPALFQHRARLAQIILFVSHHLITNNPIAPRSKNEEIVMAKGHYLLRGDHVYQARPHQN
jgi:hypothetical protein